VYRSYAEFGTYTLVGTTSSLYYTDTVTTGEWWYFVRAYNNNGYRGSSKKSVEVDLTINYAEGFLYAQSSTYHTWYSGFDWEDEEAAINSVDTPGEYLVIYTAGYFGPYGAGGYGWVSLVTNDVEIPRTKRFFENIALDGYSTMMVADKVMLGTGGVRARLQFFPGSEFEIMERSMIAIPLEPDDPYESSTDPEVWSNEVLHQDPDIRIDDLTGEYLAIYTASFQVTDDPGTWTGVHSNGYALFVDADNLLDFGHTQRSWEFPAIIGDTIMRSTIIIADKLSLDNTDLVVKLKFVGRHPWWDPFSDDTITIMERSLILIPLDFDFLYESKDDQILYPGLNQDIVFENINYNFFVMYTSNIRFDEVDYTTIDNVEGFVWAGFNNGDDTIVETIRWHNFGFGYGETFTQTNYLFEILELQEKDIRVEYVFIPDDNEEFSLLQRSMIVIPFLP